MDVEQCKVNIANSTHSPLFVKQEVVELVENMSSHRFGKNIGNHV